MYAKTVHGVKTNWLFGKGQVPDAAVSKECYVDSLLGYKIHRNWFPWKRSNRLTVQPFAIFLGRIHHVYWINFIYIYIYIWITITTVCNIWNNWTVVRNLLGLICNVYHDLPTGDRTSDHKVERLPLSRWSTSNSSDAKPTIHIFKYIIWAVVYIYIYIYIYMTS